MGRTRIWKPRQLSVDHTIRGHLLRSKYGPSVALQQRLKADYLFVKKVNPKLVSHEKLMLGILGQMEVDGLDPSSIAQYITILDGFAPLGCRAPAVVKAAEAFATDRGGRGHAVDISDEEMEAFAKIATRRNDEEACIVWIFYATGIRAVDIRRLWEDAVFFTNKKTMTLLARWTKGIQKIKSRRHVEYPMPKIQPPKLLLELATRRHKTPKRLFSSQAATYTSMSTTLKEYAATLKVDKITTGTFRRSFASRIEPFCKKHGIQKKDMLLHVSDDMDKSAYSFNVQKRADAQ